MPSATFDIYSALARHGLVVFGACPLERGDWEGIDRGGKLILIGNTGPAMWAAFAGVRHDEPDPLDRWTKRTVDPIAERAGARVIYPFDRPHPPFQRWAIRAGVAHPSPLGLLIHPRYGLWHAYRAALLADDGTDFATASIPTTSPCESCSEKPCLSACPVDAFSGSAYDVPACAGYLASPAGASCLSGGCAARNACPVGREYRFADAQIQFHMTAFARAVIPGAV